ncbi:MAG: hypothetical protein K0Q68_1252 [Moraxellaceae bacterium]|jgi:Ca2+-binding RTX toxin-like protein|nr:hypothetical protein [Moraxellaceae bacterium]
MAISTIEKLYEFTLMQLAAESYIEDPLELQDPVKLKRSLTLGTNRLGYNNSDDSSLGNPGLNGGWPGFTRMTNLQFAEFHEKFEIIHQWSDNPSEGAVPGTRPAPDTTHTAGLILNSQEMLANTGLSATLIQRRGTDEYTLSIRSTESRAWANGGDQERDMTATDKWGVVLNGFALAQLDALEKYYDWLKVNQLLPQGAKLNVTGYSLGGHLATVFTEIHQRDPFLEEWGDTVTFNGAGRGTWNGAVGNEAEMLAYYREVLNDPASAGIDLAACSSVSLAAAMGWLSVSGFFSASLLTLDPSDALAVQMGRAEALADMTFDSQSIYQDDRYAWAVVATVLKFGIAPQLPGAEHGTLADDKITQVYGYENINNVNFTANSQNNGSECPVAVESQPLLSEAGGIRNLGDYGFGHSIVLITDSLALQRALVQLDPTVGLDRLLDLAPMLTAKDTRNIAAADYESDLLENVLDSLRFSLLGPGSLRTHDFEGPGGFGDWDSRNTYHSNLQALTGGDTFKAIAGKVSFFLADAAQLSRAREDFGAFLGLYTLSPVYLRARPGEEAFVAEQLATAWPELYEEWVADRTTSPEKYYSMEWLQDRSAMLAGTLQVNAANADDRTTRDPAGIEGLHYRDLAWGGEVTVLPTSGDEVRRQVLFDSNSPETPLVGGEFADRLYAGLGGSQLDGGLGDDLLEGRSAVDTLLGGAGRDTLRGLGGNDVLIGGLEADRLEGGDGDDEYRIARGDGIDTLRDSDGKGRIFLDGQLLVGGLHESTNSWRSADGRYRYELENQVGGGLRLWIHPVAGSLGVDVTQLFIEDFHPGDLGIELPGAPLPGPLLPQLILGDVDPDWLTNFHADGSTSTVLQWDALGNIIGTAGALPRPDMLLGSGSEDEIRGGEGNDTLYGLAGADRIEGEGGNDFIAAGLGQDVLKGGLGNDILYGDSNPRETEVRAGMVPVPATAPPPLDGAIYVDSGIGWVRFEAEASSLPPASNARPDAITPVLLQLAPARFGRVGLVTAERSDYGQGRGDDDVIEAGVGDDLLYGEGGSDYLLGEAGDDHLFGGAGSDILNGGENDDLLFGDSLVFAAFRWSQLDLMGAYRSTSLEETYQAEYGNDVLRGGDGHDYLFGMAGADILYGEAGNDYLVGDFFEVVSIPVLRLNDDGSAFVEDISTHFAEAVQHHANDELDGGDGDDYLVGLAGDDTLHGGTGADVLIADGNFDEIQGRYGNDKLYGGADNDFLLGSGGDDRLKGDAGDDELWGDEYAGASGEPVVAWGGAPVNTGSSATVLALARHGSDHLEGGDGRDTLTGGGFDDRLEGGAGDDLLFGDGIGVTGEFEGRDTLYGGLGYDQLHGNGNDDRLYGGEGADMLYGEEGYDTLAGDAGDDYLEGGKGNDVIAGGDGIDTLFGGEGDDSLSGGAGDDLISAGDENDLLDGGAGRDYQDGGAGNDMYVLRAGEGEIIDNTYEMIVDASGTDTLRFEGVDPSAIIIHNAATAGDITIRYGANDGVYIQGGLNGAIDRVEIGGGASMDFGELLVDHMEDSLSLMATTRGTALYGGMGNDSLATLGGSRVFGGAGSDAITLNGGGNTIFMRRGDGVDTVNWGNGNLSAPNRIHFDKGITPDDLQIFPSGSSYWCSLNIRIDGDPDNALVLAGFTMSSPLQFKSVVGYFDFTHDDGSVYTRTYEQMIAGGFQYPFTEGADTVAGTSLSEMLDGRGGNDAIQGAGGDDVLVGGAGNDSLQGDDGQDMLLGGLGNDYLSGGAGVDTYFFAQGDGIDSIDSFNDAGDVVALAYAADELVFRNKSNTLVMSSRDGADQVKVTSYFARDGGSFSAGMDIVSADGVHFNYAAARAKALEATAGDDFIVGMDDNDTLLGLAGNDTLAGGLGDDTIDGGAGNDTLALDAGNDTYVFGMGSGHDQIQVVSTVPTSSGVGSDTILMSGLTASQVMATRINSSLMAVKVLASDDWITFNSSSPGFAALRIGFSDGTFWTSSDLLAKASLSEGDDVLILLDLDDTLDVLGGNDTVNANGGNDTLWGSGGNDTLNGGAGNDTLFGGVGDDVLGGGAGRDYLAGDDGNDKISGGEGDDSLYAGNGVDSLDGGNGWDSLFADTADGARDTLTGGADNDTYYLREAADTAVEVDGGGYDTISYLGGGAYTIPLWVERIQYSSYGVSIKVTGNSQSNFFDMQYSTSKDTLIGGAGNDTYYGVDAADVITESKTGGVDTIHIRSTSYSLAGTNLENAVVMRPTGNVLVVQAWSVAGNSAANYLGIENGFALRANGYDGNDTLEGCWNDSRYGIYDSLDGGNGDDILNGKGGSGDTLSGGAGNDTYHVFSSERLVEAASAGTDSVIAYCDYTLATHFENLTLAEYGTVLRGTGNAVANKITGNSFDNVLNGDDGADILGGGAGNDTLIGGLGIDTLAGGQGDDTFVVDNIKDIVQENAGGGRDSVQAGVTHTLSANVEDLLLTGGLGINGTGNILANHLCGNSAGNILTGMAGDDTYLFGRGSGADTVVDSDSTAGNQDVLLLEAGIAQDQLWFRQVSNNLEVSVIGSSDKVTISNWYGGSSNHVETIRLADGYSLVDSQVEQLVQAMATMTPPPLGQTTLSAAQHQQLDTVLAASWQVA